MGDGGARITDAMTAATWRAATEMGVAAILCISESGFTVRSIARFRPKMPIIGFSPRERTVRQLIGVIDGLTATDTGRFLAWDGREVPW